MVLSKRRWFPYFNFCLVFFTMIMCAGLYAEEDRIPDIIKTGFAAYRVSGPEAAIATWLRGGPGEDDKLALSSASTFRQIESLYGAYKGYTLIRMVQLTPTSKLAYFQINYDKGPVFIKFLCYVKNGGWIISGRFDLNTDPEKILPWATSLFSK